MEFYKIIKTIESRKRKENYKKRKLPQQTENKHGKPINNHFKYE